MPVAQTKSERIEIRTTRSAKALLRRAARASDMNVTDFLLDAGLNAAEEALADRRHFVLDDARRKAFFAALDRPVMKRPKLAKLLATKGALD